jgi:peptidoglycan/xylan/chitin deacetylase (PgdA/CDA1 family)
MLRSAFALASPAGPRSRLSVLIFHRVVDRPDEVFPGEVDALRFDRICGWIRQWFNVLPLDDAVEKLKQGRLPSRALAITFDDGYEDNHRVALPILHRHGLTATFFVSTGFLDGGCMWNDTIIEVVRTAPPGVIDLGPLTAGRLGAFGIDDAASRRRAIDDILLHAKYLSPDVRRDFCERVVQLGVGTSPTRLMMTPDQVRELRMAGMQVGAHTVSHPILARLDEAQARREIASSKSTLEELLGERVTLFAYPNGRPVDDYTARDVHLARECGFAAAFSTVWGAAGSDADIYQLPRFTPWDRTRWRFGARLLGNLITRRH